ncbi:hypothetical protein [Halocalculus aciditolerans]|uniref:DUF8050 domain-containing protein n=1 Tax=Halocalculus aciditolerans TaxID=1383812 RepID=A0A830F5I3_9EURY|nr:hypothetical protein [Halocalculus aciditolerans]GGL56667.1 hypothetical protein GCM10009039_13520 [Halocalculus aciditolerans]
MRSEHGMVARWRARVDARRVLLVLLAGALPWAVVAWDTGWYPVFSAGFASLDPLRFTLLSVYFSRAVVSPGFAALGTGAFLYLLSLASALAGDPDERLTAGLLVLAGLCVASFAWRVSGQRGVVVAPLGTLWLWAAAAVGYRDVAARASHLFGTAR